MTKKVTAANNGIITGQSGRTLQLTSFMKENCTGQEYRVGLKSLHDLFPAKVREKINAEERLKWWDEPYKKAAAEVLRKTSSVDKKGSPVSLTEKLNQENNEALAEMNNAYEKKFSDLKTTYDCIAFKANDGIWYAVIDTTETVRTLIMDYYGLMMGALISYHSFVAILIAGRSGERTDALRVRSYP